MANLPKDYRPQDKATHNPAQDWQGPRVHATLEIVVYEHDALPIGQKGTTVGEYVDKMLANAKEKHKVVGKLTLDFSDANM